VAHYGFRKSDRELSKPDPAATSAPEISSREEPPRISSSAAESSPTRPDLDTKSCMYKVACEPAGEHIQERRAKACSSCRTLTPEQAQNSPWANEMSPPSQSMAVRPQ